MSAEFSDFIRRLGFEPPSYFEPGRFVRFSTNGKRRDDAGYAKLFPDGEGGIVGDWRSGLFEVWQAKREKPLNEAERKARREQVEQAKREADAERERQHAKAREAARQIWEGAQPAKDDHPYLQRKGVPAYGLRVHEGKLIIPMREGTETHSLQTIGADGEKLFLSGGRVTGCYFSIGKPKDTLCVVEGYATAAAVHQATGHAVAVAFSAGNLEAVASALRAKFPKVRIVIAGDNDVSGTGQRNAQDAAQAVDGLVAIPAEAGKDWNDVHREHGAEAVRAAIEKAQPSVWPEPLPLIVTLKPEPYPIDALTDKIRGAVQEVQAFTKAPVPLVAASGLTSLSLATQALYDVERAVGLAGPVSLFLLAIADSGERKSTGDRYFMRPHQEYEKHQAEKKKPELQEYHAKFAAWKAKHAGIENLIRDATKNGESTTDFEKELIELEKAKPQPPRVPKLLRADETPDNLAYALAHEWPSAGIVSSDAGNVLGAHGMNSDSIMRNLALHNILWDGGEHSVGRKTSDSFTVRGARLTLGLLVQEPTLREFFERSRGLARGTGFLARFLVAWPESTQGYRSFTEPPSGWPMLTAFNDRIKEILNTDAKLDDGGALTPQMLTLSADAKDAWRTFHDAIESELPSGGELYDVRDVASKAADNAARLAALFHILESRTGAIGPDSFERASRIVAWHLNESRRFFGELALPRELANAARMDGWLLDCCRRQRIQMVPIRTLQQYGPHGLRQRQVIEATVRDLEDLGRVRLLRDRRHRNVQVNPALLDWSAP